MRVGDLGWVERLVSAGADVNQPQDMVGRLPADLADVAAVGRCERCSCQLLKINMFNDAHALENSCCLQVNQSGQRVTGVTPLYMAAQSGQLEVCKYLIRQVRVGHPSPGGDGQHMLLHERTLASSIENNKQQRAACVHVLLAWHRHPLRTMHAFVLFHRSMSTMS